MPIKRILKLVEADTRNPQLDSVRDDLHRLKLLWILSTTSPLLYLAISHYIRLTFFTASERGFAPLSAGQFQWLVALFAVLAAGIQAVHLVIRRRYAASLSAAPHVTTLLRLYRNRTLSLMAASEAPVLLGFILFLVQGHLWSVFLFGLVSMIYYAQSYPSETRLGSYARAGR